MFGEHTAAERNSLPSQEQPAKSLRANALARFISNGAIVTTGFVSAAITARFLGPAGKGTLSTILFITAVTSLAASLGTGDAGTVLAGGDKKRLQELLALSIPLIVCASIPAVTVVLAAAWIADWSGIWLAVAAACVLVPVRGFSVTLLSYQNALERFIRTSLISVVQVSTEVALLVGLALGAVMNVANAVLAALGATIVAIVLSVRGLKRDEILIKPRWAPKAVTKLVRLGASLISAQILAALAQRFDLILVYTLLGEAPAGRYAIALSVAHLVSYTSNALSSAAFPRLARIDHEDAWFLIPRLSRMSLTSAGLSAAFLAPVIPVLIPTLFGAPFAGAVVPALTLILGGIAWSELATLTRSVAALGHQKMQLMSFLLFLGTMAVLDLFLIPRFGIVGAASASTGAAVIALTVFLVWYSRHHRSEPLRTFVPGSRDLHDLFGFISTATKRTFEVLRHPARTWNR